MTRRTSVLVTGGAGYVGSHVVARLVGDGRRVVVLDDLSTGRADAIGESELVIGDVADADVLEDLFASFAIDAVVHAAGSKSVAESLADPGAYFANNVAGSLTVLRASVHHKVRAFIFSSSAALYGLPRSTPVTEDDPTDPTTPYGTSKLMVEEMLRWFGACHDLPYAALRYFNAAGAEPSGRMGEDWSRATNLVPVVMKAVLGAGPTVEVFGDDYPTLDGTAVRDYIHVVDLADAHARAVDHLLSGGESLTVNLGTGRGSSVAEVIAAAEQISGRTVPHVIAARRPGDPAEIWADSARAERLLGWRATLGLDDIVGSAYAWHSRTASDAEPERS